MLQGLDDGLARDALKRQVCAENRCLAVLPSKTVGEFECEGTMWAAIDGEVQWRDASLAKLAVERGNTSALIEAYRRHDVRFLTRLQGLFTLAIIDDERNRAIVATDPLGNFPVYYSQTARCGTVFGTHPKAVLAHPDVKATINQQAVFNYFYFYMSPAPYSIYEGVKKLLAGQYLLIESGRSSTHFYHSMPYRDSSTAPIDELHQETRDKLKAAVARAVKGEDPEKVAAFLSGGLDSTTVTGLLGDVTGRPAKCFTVGFHEKAYDETEFARISAQHFGADHQEEYMMPADMCDAIPKIAPAYDEPFANSSAAAGYFCAMRAKASGIDVLLAGDGGDELFAGNERYLSQRIFDPYNNAPSFLTKGFLKPAVFGFPFGDRIKLLSKARNYIRLAETPLPDRLQAWNWMERSAIKDAFDGDFLSSVDRDVPLELMRNAFGRADTESTVQKMMCMDLQITLADNDLPKVNRTCELAGIRVKFPFLDDDVVTHSARIPPDILMAKNELRHYFKEAFRDYLPAQTLSKPKQGFGLPFSVWAQEDNATREMIQDSLKKFKTRGYLKPAFIDSVFADKQDGESNGVGAALWDIVMFELWLQAN